MDAAAFHRQCLLIDGHTDVPSRLFFHPADLSHRLDDGHVDLPRLREGSVDALVFALYVPHLLAPAEGWAHVEDLLAATREQLRPGELELAASAGEVRDLAGRGAVAVILGLENGRPLTSTADVERCAALGIRYVTPTHIASHEWCDASTGERIHGGLSEAGVERVRELGRRGILIDVSHVSDEAVLHILDAATGPVFASHSSARALCDHPRNLPDELVREIARGGSIVMGNSYPAFVDPAAARSNRERMGVLAGLRMEEGVERAEALRTFGRRADELLAAQPLPPVELGVFVDHLIHLIELVGEEHVGIGTDFDGISETLSGLADVSEFPNLTAALLDRSVDPRGVELILGGNFLRLLEEGERRAEASSAPTTIWTI